jgi:TolB-like protein
VLPFENAGPAEQGAFTDGLTDAVTAKLGALPSLGVIDRHSAAQYRQTTKTSRQIGTELGVPYLVEGVVRWAKDASGAWRAQVTPTLIDARAGTTKWTGEPVLVTPGDPFTAQGSIATKVAEALQVALRPADLAGLARRSTSDPQAFEAYERGRVILDGYGRTGAVRYDARRAAAEFHSAIARDSTFADAWAYLAQAEYAVAVSGLEDPTAAARMRATFTQAGKHAAGHPRLLLTVVTEKLLIEHDTTGVDEMIERAMAGAGNDPNILRGAGFALMIRQRADTAYALLRRAALLDPRSISSQWHAGELAVQMRRWDEARQFADKAIALDSTDERGWSTRTRVEVFRGDTIALQRELARALARLPHPSNQIVSQMAYASDAYARRYMALTARELGVETLYDSINIYFDNKADAALRVRDTVRARAYYDSIRTLLAKRPAAVSDEPGFLMERALVEATLGQPAVARATVAHMIAISRPMAARRDLTDVLDPMMMARIYARLGEKETAVRWLRAGLENPLDSYTAERYAIDPTLQLLRGTPAFDQLVRQAVH